MFQNKAVKKFKNQGAKVSEGLLDRRADELLVNLSFFLIFGLGSALFNIIILLAVLIK